MQLNTRLKESFTSSEKQNDSTHSRRSRAPTANVPTQSILSEPTRGSSKSV